MVLRTKEPEYLIRKSAFPAPDFSLFRPVNDYFLYITKNCSYFIWKNEITARVSGGNEIVVHAKPGLDDRVLDLVIKGPLSSMISEQRGFIVLHGSCVSDKTGAFGFLGHSGQGKSTLAAALHFTKNYGFVSDNALALGWDETERPEVMHSTASFKLAEDSASKLHLRFSEFSAIEEGSHKVRVPVLDGKPPQTAYLNCLYVLEPGNAPSVHKINSTDAFLELVRHSYFPQDVFSSAEGIERFKRYAHLAKQVPVRRLVRPRRWDLFEKFLDVVEKDAASC